MRTTMDVVKINTEMGRKNYASLKRHIRHIRYRTEGRGLNVQRLAVAMESPSMRENNYELAAANISEGVTADNKKI